MTSLSVRDTRAHCRTSVSSSQQCDDGSREHLRYSPQVSDRFPARRSRGGDLAAPVAGLLLLLALAALVLGVTRDPGPPMLGLCCVAAVLAAAGAVLALWAFGYRRLAYALTES